MITILRIFKGLYITLHRLEVPFSARAEAWSGAVASETRRSLERPRGGPVFGVPRDNGVALALDFVRGVRFSVVSPALLVRTTRDIVPVRKFESRI